MKARLNLTIDLTLLDKAKECAASKGVSVSQLIEDYFKVIAQRRTKPSLLDILKEMPKFETEYHGNFDFKKSIIKKGKKNFIKSASPNLPVYPPLDFVQKYF